MALEIRSIDSFYGTSHILHGVSLEIEDGGLVSVLGRNGAGKTTLLRSITGTLYPRGGSIKLGGRDITRMKPHERTHLGISYVPQGREIFPDLTVTENLTIAMLGKGIRNGGPPDYIFEYFPALRDLMQRKGGVLSGGQQQQLAIARALVQEPNLLLLDEPTEGLQPSVVSEIQSIIERIQAERECAILLVEQNLEFVRAVTEKFAVMENGRIAQSGLIDELTNELAHRYLSV